MATAPAGLSPEDWQKLLGIAATLWEIAPQAEPGEIEEVLRAGFSKAIVDQSLQVPLTFC